MVELGWKDLWGGVWGGGSFWVKFLLFVWILWWWCCVGVIVVVVLW